MESSNIPLLSLNMEPISIKSKTMKAQKKPSKSAYKLERRTLSTPA